MLVSNVVTMKFCCRKVFFGSGDVDVLLLQPDTLCGLCGQPLRILPSICNVCLTEARVVDQGWNDVFAVDLSTSRCHRVVCTVVGRCPCLSQNISPSHPIVQSRGGNGHILMLCASSSL